MVNSFKPFKQSSFIPQKTFGQTTKKKRTASLYFIVSILLFLVSVAGSVGVFAYKKILESSIESKAISLQRAKEAFDPNLIEDLARLNNRIKSSEEILFSHVALTPVFALLEELTLKNVRFDQFDFVVRNSGRVAILMNGQAVDYATVVLQSDTFGQNRFFRDQIFSNINLDASGNVGFSFSAIIDPNLLSFRESIQ